VSRVSVLWPNRRDLPWLVFATALFGGLDVLVYGLSPATTGWAGPHAALVLQLSVDVSLLFLARFPVPVACWALVVAAVMLASERLAPGCSPRSRRWRTWHSRSPPRRSPRTSSGCPTAASGSR
jgi:hypothetical protein